MYKILMIVGSLFLWGNFLTGCTTKEIKLLETKCAKPSIDMSKFSEPKIVNFKVHKGSLSVSIKKSDYLKMKETNQDIKDRYVTLRAWVIGNVDAGLIKRE